MSNVLALYHIVFATKQREMTINDSSCEDLYRMCIYFAKQKNCIVRIVNGAQDHIHLLVDLHPSISLSAFVGGLKQQTNLWMKKSGKFPLFESWAQEYFAHSVSEKDADGVVRYIKDQKAHHLKFPYDSELKKLVEHVGLTFNDYMLNS
jgi:REP element-mobilizing transposase RayT